MRKINVENPYDFQTTFCGNRVHIVNVYDLFTFTLSMAGYVRLVQDWLEAVEDAEDAEARDEFYYYANEDAACGEAAYEQRAHDWSVMHTSPEEEYYENMALADFEDRLHSGRGVRDVTDDEFHREVYGKRPAKKPVITNKPDDGIPF